MSNDPVTNVDKPMTGELRKQSSHIGLFRRRNVVLNTVSLQIYPLGETEKAISMVPITADTVVSEIKMTTIRGNHGAAHSDHAIFQVIPNENMSVSATSYRPRIFGSGTDEHWFAASTKEQAERWKLAIENRAKALGKNRTSNAAILETVAKNLVTDAEEVAKKAATEGDKANAPKARFVNYESSVGGGMTRGEKQRHMRAALKRTASQKIPMLSREINASFNLIQKAQWKEVFVTNGLRIMAEIALVKDNPCLLVSCSIPASPDRALRLYYDYDRRSLWDGLTESVNLISEEDDGIQRTMHCKLRGQKVGGLWMAPRDYVVDSSWRKDDDGSIVILEVSNKDKKVKNTPGYVRAEIYSLGITLCPRKSKAVKSRMSRRQMVEEVQQAGPEEEDYSCEVQNCLLQMAVHANVGGWLAKMPLEWGQQWLYNFMLRVIGFKEVLDKDNYEAVDLQALGSTSSASSGLTTPAASLNDFKNIEGLTLPRALSAPNETPAVPLKELVLPKVQGTLPVENVYNSEEPFNLRSKTYLEDRKKEPSQGAMFTLIAMDLWEVDEPIDNVAVNMKGGLADKYLQTPGPKPYLFIVHFQVPGPPFLSFIAYFAAKPGAIENVSNFSRLFADFIEGTDAFRDSRFKFIPRVVKGSYIVKSAVGQTPALLGNKLVCSYYKGDGYFEIDVDVGSSNVAGGVLKIVKGYITALTIDMCFLLEAQATEELPEVVLGSLRFERLSLDMAKKWAAPQ